MHRNKTLLILGAEGYSGQLIARALSGPLTVVTPQISRGKTIADQLTDYASLLEPGDLVLNCLGPFQYTFLDVLEFCLANAVHYFDICAEWQVFEAMQGLSARAEGAGSMLLPGIGFDVVASDCLLGHVYKRCPDATRVQIGISGLELISRGSARTMADLIGEPLKVRRRGRITAESRMLQSSFDFGSGQRPALAVSWGDISTAWHSTGVPNIEVFFEATPALSAAVFANKTFGWLVTGSALGQTAQSLLSRFPKGPQEASRAKKNATVVVRANNDVGQVAESRLHTREAYSFTADSSSAVLKYFSEQPGRAGFQTPNTVLGADFPMSLPHCMRVDQQ